MTVHCWPWVWSPVGFIQQGQDSFCPWKKTHCWLVIILYPWKCYFNRWRELFQGNAAYCITSVSQSSGLCVWLSTLKSVKKHFDADKNCGDGDLVPPGADVLSFFTSRALRLVWCYQRLVNFKCWICHFVVFMLWQQEQPSCLYTVYLIAAPFFSFSESTKLSPRPEAYGESFHCFHFCQYIWGLTIVCQYQSFTM